MVDARIDPLVRSFERSLRAERKSERTIHTYFEALEQLSAFLVPRGRGLADATTADIQDYIIGVIERRRPSTANNRLRALHRFYACTSRRWIHCSASSHRRAHRAPRTPGRVSKARGGNYARLGGASPLLIQDGSDIRPKELTLITNMCSNMRYACPRSAPPPPRCVAAVLAEWP